MPDIKGKRKYGKGLVGPVLMGTALLLCSCQQPTDTSGFGTLSGLVLDEVSSLPVMGAEVLAFENQIADTTDTLGAFFLDSLALGEDTFVVTFGLYQTNTTLVDITLGANDETFELGRLSCEGDTLIVNDRLFIKTDGQWYQVEDSRWWMVNHSVITVKFKEDVSPEQIEAFNATTGVTVLRTNILGYMDLQLPEGADPLCVVLDYLYNELVEIAHTNAFGSYKG